MAKAHHNTKKSRLKPTRFSDIYLKNLFFGMLYFINKGCTCGFG
jgi:hypothetical protein